VLFGVGGLDAIASFPELAEVGLVFVVIELGLVVEGSFGLKSASERVHPVGVVQHPFNLDWTLEESSSLQSLWDDKKVREEG